MRSPKDSLLYPVALVIIYRMSILLASYRLLATKLAAGNSYRRLRCWGEGRILLGIISIFSLCITIWN